MSRIDVEAARHQHRGPVPGDHEINWNAEHCADQRSVLPLHAPAEGYVWLVGGVSVVPMQTIQEDLVLVLAARRLLGEEARHFRSIGDAEGYDFDFACCDHFLVRNAAIDYDRLPRDESCRIAQQESDYRRDVVRGSKTAQWCSLYDLLHLFGAQSGRHFGFHVARCD